MVHYLIKKGEIIMLKRIFKISISIAISIISAFAFIIAISMMINASKNAKEIENLYFCDYEDYKGNTFMEGIITKDIDELQTTLLTAESIDGLDNITRIRINEIVKELNDFREGYCMSSLFTENQVERFELCKSYLSNEITESVFKEQLIDSSMASSFFMISSQEARSHSIKARTEPSIAISIIFPILMIEALSFFNSSSYLSRI